MLPEHIMRVTGKRPKRLDVEMTESDWLEAEALQALYGERSMASTVRRALRCERARREREEADRLAAEQSRRELQAQLAGDAT